MAMTPATLIGDDLMMQTGSGKALGLIKKERMWGWGFKMGYKCTSLRWTPGVPFMCTRTCHSALLARVYKTPMTT